MVNIDKNKLFFSIPLDRSASSNIIPNQKIFKCSWDRCRRKTHDWSLHEPLYVDEPSWVPIDQENFETPLGRNEPFFVTRGKRSHNSKIIKSFRRKIKNFGFDSTLEDAIQKTKRGTKPKQVDKGNAKQKSLSINSFNNHSGYRNKKDVQRLDADFKIETKSTLKKRIIQESKQNIHESGRRKRDTSEENTPCLQTIESIRKRSETGNTKWLQSIEKSLIGKDYAKKAIKTQNYLHPRNKHSDVLEILEEPFFISRGKKNGLIPVCDSLLNDYYMNRGSPNILFDVNEDELFTETELGAKDKILDRIINNEVRWNKIQADTKNDKEVIDKRGVLEELNLQLDPFYVARG